jgi:hypothetical protein
MRCIGCGCSDRDACLDPRTGHGCHWVSEDPPVCSACAEDVPALQVIPYEPSFDGVPIVELF